MSDHESLYLLMFTSGLLGGAGHCIGMCGPLVVTLALNEATRQGLSRLWPQLLYHLGRITTYGVMGGAIGLANSFVTVISPIERLQNLVLGAAGAIMIVMGIGLMGWPPRIRPRHSSTGLFSSLLQRGAAFIAGQDSPGVFFPLGLLLGFIPCGILYTALIGAAGAGASAPTRIEGFLSGMFMLLCFGAGTLPPLVFLGRLVAWKRDWVKRYFEKASALVMILVGVLFIYRAVG